MVLPAGGKIHVKDCARVPQDCPAGSADDGKWELPVGAVMIKTFSFDDKVVVKEWLDSSNLERSTS